MKRKAPSPIITITLEEAQTRLIRARELAHLYSVKEGTVRLWTSEGMPTRHVSPGCVRFFYPDCSEWLNERTERLHAEAQERKAIRKGRTLLGTQVYQNQLH